MALDGQSYTLLAPNGPYHWTAHAQGNKHEPGLRLLQNCQFSYFKHESHAFEPQITRSRLNTQNSRIQNRPLKRVFVYFVWDFALFSRFTSQKCSKQLKFWYKFCFQAFLLLFKKTMYVYYWNYFLSFHVKILTVLIIKYYIEGSYP